MNKLENTTIIENDDYKLVENIPYFSITVIIIMIWICFFLVSEEQVENYQNPV